MQNWLVWTLCFSSLLGEADGRLVAALDSLIRSSEKALAFLAVFLREVERFLNRLVRAALCSFSSAAHLVRYYVKEMESIAER